MQDKLSKKLLIFMLHDSDAPSRKMYDFEENLEHIAEALTTDPETLRAAVRSLESENYLKYVRDQKGNVLYFMLDHKGLHFQEFQKMERKDFFKKSVLAPIFVSFFTAIVTTSVWPSIWNWLLRLLLQK